MKLVYFYSFHHLEKTLKCKNVPWDLCLLQEFIYVFNYMEHNIVSQKKKNINATVTLGSENRV